MSHSHGFGFLNRSNVGPRLVIEVAIVEAILLIQNPGTAWDSGLATMERVCFQVHISAFHC